MKTLFFIVVNISLIFTCCSGQKNTSNGSAKVGVNHTYIYAWLNLMPGGPSSFHITGNLRITNHEDLQIDNISIKEAIVSQNGNIIYKFSPEFETIHPEEDFSLRKNEVKEFRFNTTSRLSVSPELDADKLIDAKLIFKSGDKIFEYVINNITIEKAY